MHKVFISIKQASQCLMLNNNRLIHIKVIVFNLNTLVLVDYNRYIQDKDARIKHKQVLYTL